MAGPPRRASSRSRELAARVAALEAENAALKNKKRSARAEGSGRLSDAERGTRSLGATKGDRRALTSSAYESYEAQAYPPSVQQIYSHHDEKHGGDVEKGCMSLMCGQSSISGESRIDKKRQLVRRVYGALTLQLLLTFIIVSVFSYNPSNVTWVVLNYQPLWWISFIGSIASILVLFCGFSRKPPINIIFFVIFTVCMAITISLSTSVLVCESIDAATATCIVSSAMKRTIFQAFAITMIVFVALTLFEFQTRIDFSFLGGVLSVVLCVLLWWGIFGAILGFGGSGMAYAIVGIVLFFFYILYDTYLIAERYEDPDMWVEATIQIYLDIVNLFLFILACLSGSKD